MELCHIHSTRVKDLKQFLIFTSTVYFEFYFPEILLLADMQSQNTIKAHKDMALPLMYLIIFFYLAMPDLCHLN